MVTVVNFVNLKNGGRGRGFVIFLFLCGVINSFSMEKEFCPTLEFKLLSFKTLNTFFLILLQLGSDKCYNHNSEIAQPLQITLCQGRSYYIKSIETPMA
uniref:Uncharacterized protein n=1 Tax=Solanum lycopersicum TaxID=4081 RepID=A0A3Q7EVN9_SOLLC